MVCAEHGSIRVPILLLLTEIHLGVGLTSGVSAAGGTGSAVTEGRVPLQQRLRPALEEAPVNNTLSDAVQEPAVSNMSVAMATAPACARHLQAAWPCSLLSISASSRAGRPAGPPCPPTGPSAGTGAGGAA